MTGRERILAALDGLPVDSLPLMPITMMFAADQIGEPYGRYAADHRVLVEGQIRTAEKFDFDYVSCISDPGREAADCGAAIQYFDNQPPAVDEVHALLADKTVLARLKTPDPLGGGRMHDRVQAAALFRERIGGEKLIEGWIEGPCAEAADLRGINRLMTDFFDDPGFVRDLFEFNVAMALGVRPGSGRRGRRSDRRRRRRRVAGRPANLRGVRSPLRTAAGRRPARDGRPRAAAHLRQHPPHPAGRRQLGLRHGRYRLDGSVGSSSARDGSRRGAGRQSRSGENPPQRHARDDHGGHGRVPSPGRPALHRRRRLRSPPRHAGSRTCWR